MGVYDCVGKGSQVKLWDCEFKQYQEGDQVYDYGCSEYAVLLGEGGYVRVKEGKIVEIVDDGKPYYPEEFAPVVCLDKWGGVVASSDDLKGRAMFGYHYYWWHESHKDETIVRDLQDLGKGL